MNRPIACIVAALTLAVAACAQAGSVPTNSAAPSAPPVAMHSAPAISLSPTASPSASDATSPLTGDWDTGPYATTEYDGTKFEWDLRFDEESGVPFVTMTGWDPTKGGMPGGGDHGPYTLGPGSQLAIASADRPDEVTLYSYKLDGNKLTVTWVKNSPNAPPGDVGGSFTTINLTRKS